MMKHTSSAGCSPVRTYVRRLATLVLAAGFLAACNMDEVDQSLLPPSMQTPIDATPGTDEPPNQTDNPDGMPSETPDGDDNPDGMPSETPDGDGNPDGDSPAPGAPGHDEAPSQDPGPGGDEPGGEPIDEDPHAVPGDGEFPDDDGTPPGDDGAAGDDQVPGDDGFPGDDENPGAGDTDDGNHDPGLDDDGLGAEDPNNGDADGPAFLSVTLSWEQPLERVDGSALTGLAGFRLRYGTSEEELDREVVLDNAGLSRYVVENLSPGEWFFAVSAFDQDGRESALSNFVAVQVE